ncbi:unnamed protein product, partial [Didymodactylos carnosus]
MQKTTTVSTWKTECNKFQRLETGFYPNSASIVDFRISALLITIILNVLQHIPTSWPIQIFHSKQNFYFLSNSTGLKPYVSTGKIILEELDELSITTNWQDFTNRLFTNLSFWQRIRSEKVLVFQYDSVFCSNSAHKIQDYLQWDYVGAPWHSDLHAPVPVGNGGFSLRSRSKTLELLKQMTYDSSLPEDVWYAVHLPKVNASVAPEHIARTFSAESVFYETPMGVHKLIMNPTDTKKLCEACPEARFIPPYC